VSRRQQYRIALTFRDSDRAMGTRNGTSAALVERGILHDVPFFGSRRIPLEELERFVASGAEAASARPRSRATRITNADTSPIGLENL
jgi:hypothetical protein